MDHSEAVQRMTAERYLLDELTPEERDAFEEHFFDCRECALDLRAGAAFVDEAKIQLPELIAHSPAPAKSNQRSVKANPWFSWRPAFAGAAFASLLVVLGYQNLVTYPALRQSAHQPSILPVVPMHGATRGAEHLTLTADRTHGVALPLDLLASPGEAVYASYSVDLLGPQGKQLWTGAIAAPGDSANPSYLLVIPGAALQNGLHTIVVSGIAPNGERTTLDRFVVEIHVTD